MWKMEISFRRGKKKQKKTSDYGKKMSFFMLCQRNALNYKERISKKKLVKKSGKHCKINEKVLYYKK